ncbi:putative plant self-incompatibility S1 [Lupinus albus]|uniref:S-protein homolog n=1 Tax=Lupinus albus TaxID=3870 RepID=A0A6A4QHM2_LUPAL|nr:putative plant self-incompatibility S1 [Lupinus albus]
MNSKSVVLLMSLTILVTLQMMCGVVSGFLDRTQITINNKLPEPVLVHCKDKFNSDGPHIVLPGQDYSFKFLKTPLFTYVWSCSIQWQGVYHEFDIYDSRRDSCFNYKCSWHISDKGPCQILHNFKQPVCFSWNK